MFNIPRSGGAGSWGAESPEAMHPSSFHDGDTSSDDEGFLEEFVEEERGLGNGGGRAMGEPSTFGDLADGSGREPGDASTSGKPSTSNSNFTVSFVNHKAGMEGVDKAHVKQVVHDMSKDSAHHRNEHRKEEKVEAKIREMLVAKQRLTKDQLARYQRDVDEKAKQLMNANQSTKIRTWIHVDMDAFYAAAHTNENPTYAKIPIAVGGIGMISTANYVARTFGVRSAMPGFIAKKLCPSLVFIKPDFALYKAYAEKAREVFSRYDMDYDAVSLDEAFLDVTKYLVVNNVTGAEVATRLRSEVLQNTGGLTCSAGVAPNRRLAKICSDVNKPNGQKIIGSDREETLEFIKTLPVRKVNGVGKVLERTLLAFGIETCSDLWTHRGVVHALFSKTAAEFLLQVSLGVGTEHRPEKTADNEPNRKSLGQERTFAATGDKHFLEQEITDLASEVCKSLSSENLKARTVTVKIKKATFEVCQRQMSFDVATDDVTEVTEAALNLWKQERSANRIQQVRLLGVKASQLEKVRDHTSQCRGHAQTQTRVDKVLREVRGEEGTDGNKTNSFLCHCGRHMLESERSTHEDYHFARELKMKEDAEDARKHNVRVGGEKGKSSSKKHKVDTSQKTLFQSFAGGTK